MKPEILKEVPKPDFPPPFEKYRKRTELNVDKFQTSIGSKLLPVILRMLSEVEFEFKVSIVNDKITYIPTPKYDAVNMIYRKIIDTADAGNVQGQELTVDIMTSMVKAVNNSLNQASVEFFRPLDNWIREKYFSSGYTPSNVNELPKMLSTEFNTVNRELKAGGYATFEDLFYHFILEDDGHTHDILNNPFFKEH